MVSEVLARQRHGSNGTLRNFRQAFSSVQIAHPDQLPIIRFQKKMRLLSDAVSSSRLSYDKGAIAVSKALCRAFKEKFGANSTFFLLSEGDSGELFLCPICSIGHERRFASNIRLTTSRKKPEIQLCLERNEVFYYDDVPSNHYLLSRPQERDFLGENLGITEALMVPLSFNQQGLGVAVLDFPHAKNGHRPPIRSFAEILEKEAERGEWHVGADLKSLVWGAGELLYYFRAASKKSEIETGASSAIAHCVSLLRLCREDLLRVMDEKGMVFSLDPGLKAVVARMGSRIVRAESLVENWNGFTRKSLTYSELFKSAWDDALYARGLGQGSLHLSLSYVSSDRGLVFTGGITEMKDALAMVFGHFIERGENVAVRVALMQNDVCGCDFIFHIAPHGTEFIRPNGAALAPRCENLIEASLLIAQQGGRLMASEKEGYVWLQLPPRNL